MEEPEKPVKVKGKDQVEYDTDVAQRLQVELDKESRLEREREEEATRKKFFAVKRAKEQRNKPPTKAEQRKKICTYIKHMAGYKDKKFKGKSFDAIKQMFDKAYKQVNDFFPMDIDSSRKKAENSKKGTKAVLGEESVKRQKVEDDAEKTGLKACLEIVPNDDNIDSSGKKVENSKKRTRAILGEESVKRQKVKDDAKKTEFKACLEIVPNDDKDIVNYQIIKADGSTKYYKLFSAMRDDFERQDVLDLYRLLSKIYSSGINRVHKVHVLDFRRLSDLMAKGLSDKMLMKQKDAQGQSVFTSHAWRFGEEVLDLDIIRELKFQLGRAKRHMTWREFILAMGLHTTKDIESVGLGIWAESAGQILNKGI
ncbi:hypothetical protein Tco_1394891 [Tanacetum coccineum]